MRGELIKRVLFVREKNGDLVRVRFERLDRSFC